jgi:hypothetical protein
VKTKQAPLRAGDLDTVAPELTKLWQSVWATEKAGLKSVAKKGKVERICASYAVSAFADGVALSLHVCTLGSAYHLRPRKTELTCDM